MKRIILTEHDHRHCAALGHPQPDELTCPAAEYEEELRRFRVGYPNDSEEQLHRRTVGHLAGKLPSGPVLPAPISAPLQPAPLDPEKTPIDLPIPAAHPDRLLWLWRIAILLLLLFLCVRPAHAQFSHINTITLQNNDGTTAAFLASPFTMKVGVNCTWVFASQVATINCTGGAGGAGGVNSQVQWNSVGALAGISTFTTDGTVNTAKVGTNWNFVDPADTSKKLQFNLASITTANTRTTFIPDANNYTIKAGASTGQIPIWNAGTSTYDVSDPLVQGTQAAASTTIPNPVVIGGSDYGGTAAVRVFKVDASGNGFVTFSNSTIAVTGTFWQATQPVSIATMPSTPVTGTFWQATQPVSGTVTTSPPSNASTNIAQINGVTPLMGAGNTGTGSPRVTVSTDQAALPTWGHGATGSAVPAGATQIAGTDGTNLIAPYIDPCQRGAKTYTTISLASTTALKLVALGSSKKVYVCEIHLIAAAATNVAIITGTKVTTECDTSTAGVFGGTSAATGWNLAANGGLVLGNGGYAIGSGGTSLDVCIVASASNQLSGNIVTATF